MTPSDNLVIALIIFTFAIAIAFGIYQWRKARTARQLHQHSSVGDLREGMPNAPSAPSAPSTGVQHPRDASA